MSTQRRFTEKEIAKIFEKATRAQNAANEDSGSHEGLSLEELKQIGASTGIDSAYIMQAIAELNKDAQSGSVKKHMGLPYVVSRSVSLPDTFGEKDWERLVVDLRKTFNKRGTIKQDGSFREWSHGFIHAYVEPAPDGYELKLEAKNGNTKALLYSGILYILMAIFTFLALSSGAEPGLKTAAIIASGIMAAGVGMFSSSFIFPPRWAKKKEEQLEGICNRVTAAFSNEEKKAEPVAVQADTPAAKFLTLEDEEDLNEELKQFAKRTSNKNSAG